MKTLTKFLIIFAAIAGLGLTSLDAQAYTRYRTVVVKKYYNNGYRYGCGCCNTCNTCNYCGGYNRGLLGWLF